ncbi:DUF805 domain-containing protein [Variovorax sp. PCZ-1]|uniref:DUF805 domain-containing protein n=1 Tax=Variovorax sp. PCZ-1 TaxID=2835533 RepID=UPI001BCC5162|nr:DUF805 domain-containing protein [Variovorax sp. PCZ-1]MBS7807552.1 DUF805 domain-containing protein [Variovorax sp. PCZ-1]
MDFKTAIVTCLTKYVDFDGRASRSEFWWFSLFQFLTVVVLSFVMSLLASLASLALLLPALGVAVRRFHDIGKSGWWVLIWVLPFIGWIIAIYWAVQPSQTESNNWGAPPAV